MDDVYVRYRDALQKGHQAATAGRAKDALAEYRLAADLAGERALPHVLVGGMLLRLGRAKEALAAFDRALEREAQNIDALGGRAAALLAVGRREESARVLELISGLRSSAGEGKTPAEGEATPMSTADMLHAAGHQARRDGNVPAAIDAWLEESRALLEDGHEDAALDACMRALAEAPGVARTHLALARIYFRRGWQDQAVERVLLLDRLLSLEPDEGVAADLAALADEHRDTDERLAALAAGHAASPPEA